LKNSQPQKTEQPLPEMNNLSFTIDPRLLPDCVIATNLELKVLSAAAKVAMEFNVQHRKSVVEVLRKSITKAPDAGIDVEIKYNNILWKTPMAFLKDFKPVLEKYCQQRD